MTSTKNEAGNGPVPYPAHDAQPSSPYVMSLVATAEAPVSVTLTVPSTEGANGNVNVGFPIHDVVGVWVDVEELHPRARWLLDGAGVITE